MVPEEDGCARVCAERDSNPSLLSLRLHTLYAVPVCSLLSVLLLLPAHATAVGFYTVAPTSAAG